MHQDSDEILEKVRARVCRYGHTKHTRHRRTALGGPWGARSECVCVCERERVRERERLLGKILHNTLFLLLLILRMALALALR
jgi:hypothetical protein